MLLLWAAGARATERTDRPSDEERGVPSLEAIVVTAPGPLGRGLGTVTTLDADLLRRITPATAAEILAGAPSVRVSTAPLATTANGKQEQLLSIRGFEATETKVLVDGIPVEDPYQGVADLGRLPLVGVERITVARGPTSLLYGPNALGGVVNLESRRLEARAEGMLRSEVEAGLGQRLAGRFGVPVGPVDLLAGVSFVRRVGFRVPHGFAPQRNQDRGLRRNSDVRDVAAFFKATWRLPHDQRVQLTTHFVDFDGGVPFSVSAVEPGTLWRRTWRRAQVEAAGVVRPWRFLDVRGKLFYARFENTVRTYEDASLSSVALDGAAVSTHAHDALGFFIHPELHLGDVFTLHLAGNWRIDWLSVRDDEIADTDPRDYRSETLGVALESETLPLPWLRVVAGASFAGMFKERADGGTTGTDLVDYELLGGLRATPWNGGTLRVGFARKVGFPRLRQLYGSFGDPDLSPQVAWTFETAAGQSVDLGDVSVTAELAYFRNDVRDYIAKRDTGNDVVYENVAEALISGLEAAVALSWLERYHLRIGYTWLHTRDRRPDRALASLDFRPAHLLDVALTVELGAGVVLDTVVRYTGSRPFEQPGPDGPRGRSFPPYTLVDLGLSVRIPPGDPERNVRLFARLQNVLDALAASTSAFDMYYEDAPERPGQGWNLRFGIEATL